MESRLNDTEAELVLIVRQLSTQNRISLLNFARELHREGESARTIGLAPVLAEVDVVIALNRGKHPQSAWREKTPEHQLGKMHKHLGNALAGHWLDAETGRPHLAHAAARFLMFFGLQLDKQKP